MDYMDFKANDFVRSFWEEEREHRRLKKSKEEKKAQKKPPRKTGWITTTIQGKDYRLRLTKGQRLPRSRKGQRNRALRITAEEKARAIRERVEELQKAKPCNYSFLSEKENLVLSMQAVGMKRAKIAMTLSGGRRRWKVSTGAVKGMLERAKRKLKDNGIEVKKHGKYLEFSG